MKKIILSYCHYQGWGDSMVSLFDILNLTDYLKNKYEDLFVTLVINDIRNLDVENVLNEVLDLNFIKSFFDEVIIQKVIFDEFNNNGICTFKGLKYERVYSGRNYDIKNNIPGIFDLYIEQEKVSEFEETAQDYLKFTFDEMESKEIKKYPIFNKKVIEYVDNFIKENFSDKFESICYRANNIMDNNKIQNLIGKLNKRKKYFLSSNSSEIKKIISKSVPNVKMIRGFENENYHLSGFPIGESKYSDAFYSVCELYMLGEGKKIYYEGELPWVSFFVWYGRNVCKVELV